MARIVIKDQILNEYYILLTNTTDKPSRILIIKHIKERIGEIKYRGYKLIKYIEHIERS